MFNHRMYALFFLEKQLVTIIQFLHVIPKNEDTLSGNTYRNICIDSQ